MSSSATAIFPADLDGDGDLDVLHASTSEMGWFENTDGQGNLAQLQPFECGGFRAWSFVATDVNGDGDLDVVCSRDSRIGLSENTNGQGLFGEQKVITTDANGANSVFAADLDGDGDADILSASSLFDWNRREYVDSKIVWYENTNGQGSFGAQQVITTNANGSGSVHTADLDGDGDADVLSASRGDHKIAWYENTNGQGSFGEQQVITNEAIGARSVYAADLDGDGDADVLSASSYLNRDRFEYSDNKIAWYENTNGKGTFGPQQIITTAADGAMFVSAVDFDGDGDADVVSVSQEDHKIAWYENSNGQGSFGEQKVITTQPPWFFRGDFRAVPADVDGDGDVDVLAVGPYASIAWYENLSTHVTAGDANRDLQFDERDIGLVQQAAKYLTGEFATFEEGDWDGDGVFDQLDIVAALRADNYLRGTYETRAGDNLFVSKFEREFWMDRP